MKKLFLLLLFALYQYTVPFQAEYTDAIPIPAPHTQYSPRTDPETCSVTIPTILVLHYTATSLALTLKIFLGHAQAPVTSHYTISDDGVIFQHTLEEVAAHHAGLSYWRGKAKLNKDSLGIEHVNDGYKHKPHHGPGIKVEGSDKEWYPFDNREIKSSIDLCKYLIQKYHIEPRNVVGHADIAPGRKVDPGPLFPWRELAEQGIGIWPDFQASWPLPCLEKAQQENNLEQWLLNHLHIWGYTLPDKATTARDIIQAFQMHFRQHDISGKADLETAEILNALMCNHIINETEECPCNKYIDSSSVKHYIN